MQKLEILTGGVKIPELETLKKEANEFLAERNSATGAKLVSLDFQTHISIEGEGDKQQQIITPFVKVIYDEE